MVSQPTFIADLWRPSAGMAADGGWTGLHDQVMGGRSSGVAQLMPGNAHDPARVQLAGTVSRDHGGGFASFRLRLAPPRGLGNAQGMALTVRGDGGVYKCCLHRQTDWDGVQWQADFLAPSAWNTLTLPLSAFVARRRGRAAVERALAASDVIHQIGLMAVRPELGAFALCLASIAWV
jgi:hypothetical protein